MVFHPILCYLSPKILIFQELLIVETWNLHHWIWHRLKPLNMCHSSHFNAFSQSKSIKCKIFSCLLNSPDKKNEKSQFDWGKSVQKGLNICTYRFLGMLITMHYVRTLCYKSFLSYNGVFWTPPDKKWKKNPINLYKDKVFWKGLKICTYRFLGMLITMHYVRTLCYKYVLSYDGFFPWFLTGRSRYRVQKHGVWVEWDPRRTAA